MWACHYCCLFLFLEYDGEFGLYNRKCSVSKSTGGKDENERKNLFALEDK